MAPARDVAPNTVTTASVSMRFEGNKLEPSTLTVVVGESIGRHWGNTSEGVYVCTITLSGGASQ